jgi:membrane protein
MATHARPSLAFLPLPGFTAWRAVARATLRASLSDRVALSAAGCAFFATLALFPAMSMLVSLYGLVFNPRAALTQVLLLRDLLPPPAFLLIADRLHHLVTQRPMRLGVGLGLGFVLAFWSAMVGLRAMLSAINLAYGDGARPSLLRFQLTALAMTVVAMLGAVVLLGVLVWVPTLLDFISPWRARMQLVHLVSIALLAVFTGQAIALLYRFGPAGWRPVGAPDATPGGTITASFGGTTVQRHRVVTPGAVLALLLGLAASGLLTFYIDHLGSFGATYGPLGAPAGVMLWLFGNAYAVLLGAELNAQIERHHVETVA